jgi:hypothetical protein
MLAGSALLATACAPAAPTPVEVLEDYYDAVQQRDFDRLYCLLAGAAESVELGATGAERRTGFESWARAHYDVYETGRDDGRVELDEQGLALVKLFSLGRGTYLTHEPPRAAGPDARIVESRVRFGYAHIDLSHFSPGTTLYVCGAPVGRVHPIRIPSGTGEVSLDVLDTVTLEWTLVRVPATEACPGGWAVAAGAAVDGSEQTVEVTWAF